MKVNLNEKNILKEDLDLELMDLVLNYKIKRRENLKDKKRRWSWTKKNFHLIADN